MPLNINTKRNVPCMSPCFPCGFSPDRGDISLSTNTGQNLGNSCCSFLQKQQLNALLNVIFHFGSCLQPTPVLQQTPPRQSCTFLLAANFQSAFQGQGGFHAPHAMKTLLDPERHNTEGVFRNLQWEAASTSAGRKSIPVPTT